MTQLDNKIVWITGASGGIGEGLALRAAQRGARLILSARRETELERVRQSCPRPQDVAVLPLDLASLDDPDAAAASAASFFGRWTSSSTTPACRSAPKRSTRRCPPTGS